MNLGITGISIHLGGATNVSSFWEHLVDPTGLPTDDRFARPDAAALARQALTDAAAHGRGLLVMSTGMQWRKAFIGEEWNAPDARFGAKLAQQLDWDPDAALPDEVSSMDALAAAVLALQEGKADYALVGAIQTTLPREVLDELEAASLLCSGPRHFFDADARAIQPQMGGVMVVLQPADDRKQAYAVLRACHIERDSLSDSPKTWPRASEAHIRQTTEAAYANTPFDADAISFLEFEDAGGSMLQEEVNAVRTVFGSEATGELSVAVGSLKSVFGDCLCAAGLAGLAKLALSLYHRVIPASICQTPASARARLGSRFYIATQARPWFSGEFRGPRRAGLTSVGPDLGCAHVIVEEYVPDGANAFDFSSGPWLGTEQPAELFLLSGDSRNELLEEIRRVTTYLARHANDSPCSLAALLAGKEAGTHRLAIVAEDIPSLVTKLITARKKLCTDHSRRSFQTRDAIFYAELADGADPGRIAWMFPGHGSQHLHMLEDLCLRFPKVRTMFDRLDEAFYEKGQPARTTELHPPHGALTSEREHELEALLADPDVGLPACAAASLAINDLLHELSVPADVILGYSNGENVGIFASGKAQASSDVFFNLMRRVAGTDSERASRATMPTGRALAVSMPDRAAFKSILDAHHEKLYWSMNNSPNQDVLFGDDETIEQVIPAFRAHGAICVDLPFSIPFHTPLFKEAVETYRPLLQEANLSIGHTRQVSCYTATAFPDDPDTITDLVIDQLTHRVRFVETIEYLYEQEGVRLFIEVGPGNLLTGFVNDILRGRDYAALPSLGGLNPGLQGLLQMLARLFVKNVPCNTDALYRYRNVTPLDPADLEIPPEVETTATPVDVQVSSIPSEIPRETIPEVVRSRILQEHFQLMREFLDSQQRALQKLNDAMTTPPTVNTLAGVAPVSLPLSNPRMRTACLPFLGNIIEQTPTRLHSEYVLDPQHDHFLRDHCFGKSACFAPTTLSGLMVLPMTFTVEVAAEAACALVNPTAVVIAMQDIRAQRWLALDKGTLRLEAEATLAPPSADGSTVVNVKVFEASAKQDRAVALEVRVCLATEFPAAPRPKLKGLQNPRQPRFSARDFYRNFIFHGPLLRGVRQLDTMYDNGCDAQLMGMSPAGLMETEAPAFKIAPVVVDALTQLSAYWILDVHRIRWFGCFPVTIAKIEQFGSLAPGTPLNCRAVIGLRGQDIREDAEFLDARGKVHMRVDGLLSRKFDLPQDFVLRAFYPDHEWSMSKPTVLERNDVITRLLSPLSEGFFDQGQGIWKRVLAHAVLGREERAAFYEKPDSGPRRTEWLLGRVAAKEAICQWALEEHGVLMGAAEVQILPDTNGKPTVHCDALADHGGVPCVSISHIGTYAAAAVRRDGGPIGVDLEDPLRHEQGDWLKSAFEQSELDMTPNLEWRELIAMWCAKEAAAKAAGSGFAGNPKAWKIIERSPQSDSFTVEHDGKHFPVSCHNPTDLILSLCTPTP